VAPYWVLAPACDVTLSVLWSGLFPDSLELIQWDNIKDLLDRLPSLKVK
jgi:hypothetical protein